MTWHLQLKIIKQRRNIHVNKTYVWWGGTAQVLIMQAGYNRANRAYGYNTSLYGSLSPDYIEYQGTYYRITALHSANDTFMTFADGKMPPVKTIVIEVKGRKYTMTKDSKFKMFEIQTAIFTNKDTYTIKILSMQ